MKNVESFFYFPEQAQNVLCIIRYVLTEMMIKKRSITSIHKIKCDACDSPKRHYFKEVLHMEESVSYSIVPALWNIEIDWSRKKYIHPCPNEEHHVFLEFLNDIMERTLIRKNESTLYSKLHTLLEHLIKEYTFSCNFCVALEKELEEYGKYKEILIPFYFNLRATSEEEFLEEAKSHIECSEIILGQTRSDRTRNYIMNSIKYEYDEVRHQLELGLLGEIPLTTVYQTFRRQVISRIHKQLQFISFERIRWDDWMKSILSLELSLYEKEEKNKAKFMKHLKKTLFLLYFLFEENEQEAKEEIWMKKLKQEPIQITSLSIHDLYEYHPLFRNHLVQI